MSGAKASPRRGDLVGNPPLGDHHLPSTTRGECPFDPIEAAGAGSATDRGGRLVNTLEWLKDKALTDGSDLVEIAQLDRFLKAIDHPQASWEFCAVAVIDSDFVRDEIAGKLDLAVEPVKALGVEGLLLPLGLIPGAASEGQSIATRAAYEVLLHAHEAPSAGFRP